jgi:hypothetical protein
MTAYWLVYVSDEDTQKSLRNADLFVYDASVTNRATKELAD